MEGNRTAGAPAFFTYVKLKMNDEVQWNNSYVIGGLQADSRTVLSHEMGHGQGLGHTNIDAALMKTGGRPFWKPQSNDRAGIVAIYGAYP